MPHTCRFERAASRRALVRVFGAATLAATVERQLSAAMWSVTHTVATRWDRSLRDWLDAPIGLEVGHDAVCLLVIESHGELAEVLAAAGARGEQSRPIVVLLSNEVCRATIVEELLQTDVDEVLTWDQLTCLSARLERCLARRDVEHELTRALADQLEAVAEVRAAHALVLEARITTLHARRLAAMLDEAAARVDTPFDGFAVTQLAARLSRGAALSGLPAFGASGADDAIDGAYRELRRHLDPLAVLAAARITATASEPVARVGFDTDTACRVVADLVIERRLAHLDQEVVEIRVDVTTQIDTPYVRVEVTGPAVASVEAARVDASLALCERVAHSAGGLLSTRDDPDRGRTLELLLPVLDVPSQAESHTAGESPRITKDAPMVLLVEDQPALVRLMVRLLRQEGYEVISTPDAEQALDLWSEVGDRVEVLIADRHLPATSGDVLAERLRELRPTLPIIFVSGRSSDPPRAVVEQPDRTALLAKPFSGSELVAALRALLSELD